MAKIEVTIWTFHTSLLVLRDFYLSLIAGTITSNGVETGQPAEKINQNQTTLDPPSLSNNNKTKIEVSNEKKGRSLISALGKGEINIEEII